jgi:hypothetical protein
MLRMEMLGVPMRTTPQVVVNHTYGVRSGLGAVLRLRRAYAEGNGALAAKLTLMGDPRGKEWLRINLISDLKRPLFGLRHFYLYWRAYRRCLRDFLVDERGGVLALK